MALWWSSEQRKSLLRVQSAAVFCSINSVKLLNVYANVIHCFTIDVVLVIKPVLVEWNHKNVSAPSFEQVWACMGRAHIWFIPMVEVRGCLIRYVQVQNGVVQPGATVSCDFNGKETPISIVSASCSLLLSYAMKNARLVH